MTAVGKFPCDDAAILAGDADCAPAVGGRWVLAATILGSSLAFIDSTVVNVALPALQSALDASLAGVQWVVEAYALTLAALLLTGGAMGDAEAAERSLPPGSSCSLWPRHGAACREVLPSSSRLVPCKASAPRCSFPGASRSSARHSRQPSVAVQSEPGRDSPRSPPRSGRCLAGG